MMEYDPYDDLPEMPEELLLPAYLKQGSGTSKTYGELSYNRRSKSWVIKGEPTVCQMAKRLFPGCDGKGRGVARFTANRRNAGDKVYVEKAIIDEARMSFHPNDNTKTIFISTPDMFRFIESEGYEVNIAEL